MQVNKKIEDLKQSIYERDFTILRLINKIDQLTAENKKLVQTLNSFSLKFNRPIKAERVEFQKDGVIVKQLGNHSPGSRMDIQLEESFGSIIKSDVQVLDGKGNESIQPLIVDHDDSRC